MYVPKYAECHDKDLIESFIQEHLFGTLVTFDAEPFANHFPFLLQKNGAKQKLVGHMARSNPQRHHLERGAQALVIFQGAHAYISPSLYAKLSQNRAPEDYAAVLSEFSKNDDDNSRELARYMKITKP